MLDSTERKVAISAYVVNESPERCETKTFFHIRCGDF